MKRYDLTAKIAPNLTVYPGDMTVKIEPAAEVGVDDSLVKVCHMGMSNHTGTHIDFPCHLIKADKDSDDYSLDDLIMPGIIIDVPKSMNSITREFVAECRQLKNRIVFFKTRNSEISKYAAYQADHVYLEPEAAEYLVEHGVKIVGIDYMSIDGGMQPGLPSHVILLKHDVLIVENLDLSNISAGEYKIYILPLNLKKADGAPVRVFAEA